MQPSGDQLVDFGVTPAGLGQSHPALQVIGGPRSGFAADQLEGLMDSLQAVADRAREERVQQQKRCHPLWRDVTDIGLAEHLIGAGTAQQRHPLQFVEHATDVIGTGKQ